MVFTPTTTSPKQGLEGKVDLTGIRLIVADDRLMDHATRIAYLRECGADVGTYEIAGIDADHAERIHRAMGGRHLLLLDVNTELAGSSGWDIGERLMQDFVPEEQIEGRYEVVFLTGDPTVSATLEKVREQAGFSAIIKTPNHRDLGVIIRGKRESKGYFDGVARRVETRYARLIDEVRGMETETAPEETEEPGVYSGAAFMRELKAHIYGNANGTRETHPIRLIEMGTGNVRYLAEGALTTQIEPDIGRARLDKRVLYWGPKNGEGVQNIFGTLTSLVRALHVLSGGKAVYHFHLMDGARRYESEPIMPDGIRLLITATAPGSNLALLEAATSRYQGSVEGALQGRFQLTSDPANERIRYSLLIPHVKE